MRAIILNIFLFLSSTFAAQSVEFPIGLAKEILTGAISPVNIEGQTQRALDATASALGETGTKDIAIVLPESFVKAHVMHGLQQLESVQDLKVDLKLEEGRFAYSIAGTFSEEEFEIATILRGAIALEIKDGKLQVLPVIEGLEISHISFDSSVQETIAEASLRRILPRMPGRLSAVLTNLIDPIPLDFDFFELDIQKELRALDQVRSASGPKLKFALTPEKPAIFVSPGAVYVLANLPGSSAGNFNAPNSSYEFVENAVLAEVKDLAGTHLDDGGIAVRKAAIARYMNAALPDRRPLISADVASNAPLNVKFNESIELAKRPNFTCKPNKSCRSAACSSSRNCGQPHDTRDCRACLLRAPRICVPNFPSGQTCHGGHCVQMGNDPTCEVKKATQNAAYAAAKAACEAIKSSEIATCEARETAKKAVCEGEKQLEVAECEAKRGIQNLLAELGGVGSIAANIGVTYSGKINVTSISFKPDLDVIAVVKVTARARAKGTVSFTPYDVVGHTVCVSNWRKPLDVSAASSPANITLTSAIKLISGKPYFVLETRGAKVTATSLPPLKAFFDGNPELRALCPGLNVVDLASDAVKRVTGASPHPIQDGNYEIDIPALKIQEPFQAITLSLGGKDVALSPSVNGVALLFKLYQ